jgi:hypothetical protein
MRTSGVSSPTVTRYVQLLTASSSYDEGDRLFGLTA